MKKDNRFFVIMTILLILIILFCSTETVMSRECMNGINMEKKHYYAKMEKEYLSGMKNLLCEKGYSHSGITIRWISDAQGLRNYTVMIHHRKLSALDNDGIEELLQELSVTEFNDEGCSFNYEFITT